MEPGPTKIAKADAAARGLKRYFTGVPCKHGHVCERYTKRSLCVDCCADKRARWGMEHPDRVKAGFSKWYTENREKSIAAATAWRKANPEKRRATNQAWTEANREKVRESYRQHYWANRPAMLEKHAAKRIRRRDQDRIYRAKYLQDHLMEHSLHEHKRRARKRGSGGEITPSDLLDIFIRQRHRCAYCRRKLVRVKKHTDHIVALAKGGSNDRRNAQILCATCNLKKGAKDPVDFARSLGMLI